MISFTEALRDVLMEYRKDLAEAAARAKPGRGLFGLGSKAADDPCHDVMDKQIEALSLQVAETPQADTAAFLRALWSAEDTSAWPASAKWMLIAIQRHGIPLISSLTTDEARDLFCWYQKRYPPSQRLPVQENIIRTLKKKY